jgi:hypothetical protein
MVIPLSGLKKVIRIINQSSSFFDFESIVIKTAKIRLIMNVIKVIID